MPKTKKTSLFRGIMARDCKPVREAVPERPEIILEAAEAPEQHPITASQMKVKAGNVEAGSDRGNRMIDLDNLLQFVEGSPCTDCLEIGGVQLKENKSGIASILTFQCRNCGHERFLHTSKDHTYEGSRFYENNTRLVAGTMAIGKNYESISKLLAYLNLPGLMSYRFWRQYVNHLDHEMKEAADASMIEAADEEREVARRERLLSNPQDDLVLEGNIEDIMTSCDGTWQRRGFSSHNGVCTVLTGNGRKVVDVDIRTDFCLLCSQQRKKLNDVQFQQWVTRHQQNNECHRNHTGSAGSMEPQGMLDIFRRSVATRKLRYVHFLGDGDSKTFKCISEAQPPIYPGITIDKLECTGHVQKRAGNKLKAIITKCANKNFTADDGTPKKGLGGQRGITEWHVRRIQGHYGAAIRDNAGSLENMRRAVWAIYYHRRGDHSKCSEQCPAVRSQDFDSANAHQLPNFVMDLLLPAFTELASDDLLKKCVHGGTQNNNEAFHHLIWDRCPKTNFAGIQTLRVAVHGAIVTFNEGEMAALNVLKRLGIGNIGSAPCLWATIRDQRRIRQSIKQASLSTKTTRKRKSLTTVLQTLKMQKVEGVQYESGAGFD
jgi:hypothetical protein